MVQVITILDGVLTTYSISRLGLSVAMDEKIVLESTAFNLRDNIAKWYVGLQTLALVGLLSVLVYVGIKIILTSGSAQDKAKYVSLLKDWIVAICILFILHYIMAFMMEFIESLNNIIKDGVVSVSVTGELSDTLMNTVREEIGESYENVSVKDTAGYVLMYLALVILTGVFTFQYLRRVVFMAFLTMIAPLVTLTYPIDKMKDSKAQAFSFWLREYIFNCLIQPVHLLLYSILITSAIDLATSNILYSIVALAFLVPAEKFIKEMFGMKSSSSAGVLGAAAGGAMVMTMLNKIKSKPSSGGNGASASSNSNGVRTSSRNSSSASDDDAPSDSPGGNENNQNRNNSAENNPAGNSPSASGETSGNNKPSGSSAPTRTGNRTSGSYSSLRGLGAVGRKILGPKALMAGAKLTRATGGVLMGGALGTIALAAQMADGDLIENTSQAALATGTTAVGGYAAGSGFVDNTLNGIGNGIRNGLNMVSDVNDTFEKGAHGFDDSVEDWKEALQLGVNGQDYARYSKAGFSSPETMSKIKNKSTLSSLSSSKLKQRKALAEAWINSGLDEQHFDRLARTSGMADPKDINTLKKEIEEMVEVLF